MKQPYLLAIALVVTGISRAQAPNYPNFPSETPTKSQPSTNSFDYEKREVMIPMRDGIKLHTIILIPKGGEPCPHTSHPHPV